MARRLRAEPSLCVPWLCGFVAMSCLAMRTFEFYRAAAFDHYRHMRPFHLPCDAIAFGVLLSYLNEFRPKALRPLLYWRGRFLLAISVMCLMPALVFPQETPIMYIPGLTLVYLER